MFSHAHQHHSRTSGSHQSSSRSHSNRGAPGWEIPVFFGILFLLSIAELFFSVDSFQYLQRTHTWQSKTEKYRLGFLIFSSARMIAMSAVYMGCHCAQKVFHSMFHTVFLVISTILWIVSGVLIHSLWGVILCRQGVGPLCSGGFRTCGLTECHELKIIEILAWVLAAVSILATIPVVWKAMRGHSVRSESEKNHASG